MNVLENLQAQFPGQLVLYAPDLAKVLGKSEKALSHLIARGQLPFPTKKLGGKRCVSIFHVAEWLAADEDGEAAPLAIVDKPKAPRRRSGERSGIGARLMEMRLDAARVLLSAGDEFYAAVAHCLSVGTVAAALMVRLRIWQQLGERLVSSESRVAVDDEHELKAIIAWLREQAEGSTYAQLTVREGRVKLYHAQSAGGDWCVTTDKL